MEEVANGEGVANVEGIAMAGNYVGVMTVKAMSCNGVRYSA